jgi:putative transcriptional regulator
MPIVIRLDLMLAKRKMKLKLLSDKVCVPMGILSALNSGRSKEINFVVLNRICVALSCQPGDLLEYMTDNEYNSLFSGYHIVRVGRKRRLRWIEEHEKYATWLLDKKKKTE